MKHTQLKPLYLVFSLATAISYVADAKAYGGNCSYYSHNVVKPEEVVLGAIGAIAAGVGVYALGSYFEWWGAPSNDELISQGRDLVLQAAGYNSMYRIAQRAQLNNRVLEDALYECAILKHGSTSMHDYMYSLQSLILSLKTSAEKLSRRIDDIERGRSSKYRHGLNDMRAVLNAVRTARSEMEFLYSYLNDHRSYFRLFEIEDELAQEYARELGAVQQYAYNEYDLVRAVRTALAGHHIISKTVCGTDAFHLIKVIRKLGHDISNFEQVMHQCSYHYVNRLACSRSLIDTLKRIKELVVSDPEYARLLAQHEAAKREEERLRLERERLANEKRIASAREREAYAKEREARAREEQNRLKYHENRLREQELRDRRNAQHAYFYN